MRAALHYDPPGAGRELRGVWSYEEGNLNSYYPNGLEFPFAAGQSKMQAFLKHIMMTPAGVQISWDDWCFDLSGKTPVKIWWNYIDFEPEKETLEQLFKRLDNPILST